MTKKDKKAIDEDKNYPDTSVSRINHENYPSTSVSRLNHKNDPSSASTAPTAHCGVRQRTIASHRRRKIKIIRAQVCPGLIMKIIRAQVCLGLIIKVNLAHLRGPSSAS